MEECEIFWLAESSYEPSSVCIKVSGSKRNFFVVKNALKQDCLMSLWLFNTSLNGVVGEMYSMTLGRGVMTENGFCVN